jgi:hypothetical protein
MKHIAGALAMLGLVAFIATSWWALESSGVAVVETRGVDGSPRSTHVWYVEPDGELWLEAGSPENGWFRDVQENSTLTFTAKRHSGRYRAQPLDSATAHRRIRQQIRAKYGFRDRWIGLLVDTSRSVAVRLVPDDEKEDAGQP